MDDDNMESQMLTLEEYFETVRIPSEQALENVNDQGMSSDSAFS